MAPFEHSPRAEATVADSDALPFPAPHASQNPCPQIAGSKRRGPDSVLTGRISPNASLLTPGSLREKGHLRSQENLTSCLSLTGLLSGLYFLLDFVLRNV